MINPFGATIDLLHGAEASEARWERKEGIGERPIMPNPSHWQQSQAKTTRYAAPCMAAAVMILWFRKG